ncbi:MAG: YlbF family regulator [Syntrophomonadaceae bacterium]|nr:YlbF family regulator [Syntrophomonadaceae bacterium]
MILDSCNPALLVIVAVFSAVLPGILKERRISMNVHDKAHELARALRQSEAYLSFKEARERLEKDARALEMVKDFKQKQLEVQQSRLLGMEVSEEKLKSLDSMFQLLNQNPLIADYFRSEITFIQIVSDVQNILQKAIEEDF